MRKGKLVIYPLPVSCLEFLASVRRSWFYIYLTSALQRGGRSHPCKCGEVPVRHHARPCTRKWDVKQERCKGIDWVKITSSLLTYGGSLSPTALCGAWVTLSLSHPNPIAFGKDLVSKKGWMSSLVGKPKLPDHARGSQYGQKLCTLSERSSLLFNEFEWLPAWSRMRRRWYNLVLAKRAEEHMLVTFVSP